MRFPVFSLAIFSMLLMWLSFPPIGIWWLAWLAPVPLIWLVSIPQLPNGYPYRQIWLAGFLYWLATFYFIPIPHPALWFGWLTVCLYMSIYTPLFVAITRIFVHQYRVPVVLAAPIAWTGIECFRCYFATGMAMACTSHTQYQQPVLIQIADLSGAYTLTFAIIAFASGIAVATSPNIVAWALLPAAKTDKKNDGGQECSRYGFKQRVTGALTSMSVLALVIGYGQFRLHETHSTGDKKIQVAIIQSSIDILFRVPTQAEQTARYEQIRDLTLAAREKWPQLDLILWPESSFPMEDLLSDYNDEATAEYFSTAISTIWQQVIGYPLRHATPVPMLVGTTTIDPDNETMFNSALLVDKHGIIKQRYYKNHRVMFGEYVPFAEWFPFLQEITPIGRGLTAGTKFEAIDVNGIKLTPSICFETTVPHLIRRQVNTLAARNEEPDAIVNLTNDGWFFGTSCLDLHLACNVFRAVETRKTNLVCANTGLSAEIDPCGRILQRGPRRDVGILMAEGTSNQRSSIYRLIGDWIPGLMAVTCGWILIRSRMSQTRP